MLQHFGNNEKSFLLQLSIRIMGKTRNSAKQVISEPLARTKQASTKPAAQKARKGVNSPLTQNLLINKLLWVIIKIVCEWVNYLGEVEGYFVKYEGFEHLDEYKLFFRNLFLKLLFYFYLIFFDRVCKYLNFPAQKAACLYRL